MSEAVLKPGISLGAYPQRSTPLPDRIEQLAARLGGQLMRPLHWHPAGLRRIVARIDGEGARLAALSDQELATTLLTLRRVMLKQGMTTPLLIRAFAMIREYAGRTLGMRHFDVQLMGGWVMAQGRLAEMQTGEGKTLTATLPAAAAALAGIPVHVISVNDYLVKRDSTLMRPLYEALGLNVGFISEDMGADQRRAAYACDITYCSNKQVAFDYLRDRILMGGTGGRLHLQMESLHRARPRRDDLLMRGLCFAIVDEADSALIDEARTPLIIAKPVVSGDLAATCRQALELADGLQADVDYLLEAAHRDIRLTASGKHRIAALTATLGGVWQGEKRRQSLVLQALQARHLYQRDRDYLVKDGKVQIIDEYTGRLMADRSWERGLHQMIETKEGCALTGERETLARMSYQRFFRRYLRLAGMTGTGSEVAGELWTTYGLDVVAIPTHRPCQRQHMGERLFLRAEDKWRAVLASTQRAHAAGRPVLIGTRSVAASEHLSDLLNQAGLRHQVLNARQDAAEADIVHAAGEAGRITVATNMAGRGTDIPLAPGVAARGGLHVIATERNDSRRIDRQLFGRCARQGDPGSYEVLLSLEDELLELHCPAWLVRLAVKQAGHADTLSDWLRRLVIWLAQYRVERRHRHARIDLLRMDDQLGKTLAFTGRLE